MKIFIILMLILSLCGCSTVTPDNMSNETENQVGEETVEYITYEDAFSYVKQCEENIIKSNAYNGTNKYGESAAEKIVYSDEYAGLYCAWWDALEEIGTPDDSRYGKSKMRWQVDFTNEDYKQRLIDAYNEGGEDAFYSKYADIYSEEILPILNARWKAEQ